MLNDSAHQALSRLERLIEDRYGEWSVSPDNLAGEITGPEWFDGPGQAAQELEITANTTDQELEHLTKQVEREIATFPDRVYVPAEIESFLTAVRDDLRGEVRDRLEEVATAAESQDERNRLIRQILRWQAGDTPASIGSVTDLPAEQVQQIDH